MKRLIYILLFLPFVASAQVGRYPFYTAPVVEDQGEYVPMSAPANIAANALLWLRADTLVTISEDNHVSAIADITGNSPNLAQAGDTSLQPLTTASGILWDGSNDYMTLANTAFDQPLTIYLVIKQETWTDNSTIMDGEGQNSCRLYQKTSTPGLQVLINTTNSSNNTNAAIGAWVVIVIQTNTTLNSFQINDTEAVTWEDSADMNALSLGRKPAGTPYYANFRLKEMFINPGTDVADTIAVNKTYLKLRNKVTY